MPREAPCGDSPSCSKCPGVDVPPHRTSEVSSGTLSRRRALRSFKVEYGSRHVDGRSPASRRVVASVSSRRSERFIAVELAKRNPPFWEV
ncbi:hypothetical protein QUB80_34480 [Chlorogloeopsis sp. ULAP01]|uniref:hypothetical protein n=1 Tax=Chlorogloeopsis sp. ULAP01 TaxID=3056483 RepID=UPI0025AB2494|nr:hypothetical protein [Chlorogloeopsis sp. ULAP01]MDM9385764.1 hypothetical protein [Chlorogloeopsis sp. ULAP01]